MLAGKINACKEEEAASLAIEEQIVTGKPKLTFVDNNNAGGQCRLYTVPLQIEIVKIVGRRRRLPNSQGSTGHVKRAIDASREGAFARSGNDSKRCGNRLPTGQNCGHCRRPRI